MICAFCPTRENKLYISKNAVSAGVQIVVVLRYARDDVPVPSDEENTPEFRNAVAKWHGIWEKNDIGLLSHRNCRKFLPGKPRKPLYGVYADVTACANALALQRNSVDYEIVRTPVAHFLEDYAYLEWACSTGFPVYGLAGTWQISVDETVVTKSWVFRSCPYAEKRFQGWKYVPVFGFATNGNPPSADSATLNASSDIIKGSESYPIDTVNDEYYQWPGFLDEAGRGYRTCTLGQLPDVLKEYYDKGLRGAFIKSVACKHGFWNLTFPSSGSGNVTAGMLFGKLLDISRDDNIMTPSYFSTGEPLFMVQEPVSFRDEYRFFIVNRIPVCGTPVRRADTVHASLHSGVREGRFRPFMCADREADGPRHERATTAAYVKRARAIIRKLPAECIDMVLDLGTDTDTGRIIPVEVNTLRRAGLYGMHPARTMNVLLREALTGKRAMGGYEAISSS